MLTFLKNSPADSQIRKDLVSKISMLSEKFAPSKQWYIKTINQLFELGGTFITPNVIYNFTKLLREWEEDNENEESR